MVHINSIDSLAKKVETYLPNDSIKKIHKAYKVAEKGHKGQFRKSGEPYISHPLEVAMILAELKLDVATICSALLHDCIEDTKISKQQIKQDFGEDIANIVDGVTKLDNITHNSAIEIQAQNFRKLFLAMSADIRVILIKLSDRLHNIRTISAMPLEKRIYIAKETLELHAPIANRLGLNNIKYELEDLAFKTLYPYRYKVIEKYINKNNSQDRNIFVDNIKQSIKTRLTEDNIKNTIIGRAKDPYSIFNKMRNNNLQLREMSDVYAFRIVVNDIDSCYITLGSIHNLYKPLPGKFKDYIALPKKNGYQSLHTVLCTDKDILIEVQIRSKDMDFIAKQGIAAHWAYKDNTEKTAMRYWIKDIEYIQKKTDTPLEFLKEVKTNLYSDEVFVFTPDGKIVQLPYKSTIIDFAYAVHTEIGSHCISAKIDKKIMPLYTKLISGQTIEIIIDKSAQPKANWLNFVKTPKARLAIKSELKHNSPDKLVNIGKKLLESTLLNEGFTLSDISSKDIKQCLHYLRCSNINELFIKIGLGDVLIPIVINLLIGNDEDVQVNNITIKNIQNTDISCANCCYPIPDDEIIGIMSADKGLIIHNAECKNLNYVKLNNPQWLKLEWGTNKDELFSSLIRCDVKNRRGVLASLASVISKLDVSIDNVVINERNNTIKSIIFTLLVHNKQEVQKVCTEIKKMDYVSLVGRP